MKKKFKVGLLALFTVLSIGIVLSCSEDNKDEKPNEEISVHPPEWLYGDWQREIDNDNVDVFKFKSDDFLMTPDSEFTSAELLSVKDYIKLIEQGTKSKIRIKESYKKSNDYYRLELIRVENNEPYLVFSFDKMGDDKVNYCPFNTEEFKTAEFTETCSILTKKK